MSFINPAAGVEASRPAQSKKCDFFFAHRLFINSLWNSRRARWVIIYSGVTK